MQTSRQRSHTVIYLSPSIQTLIQTAHLITNEQACKKSPWSRRGYQAQIYLSPLCSAACDFYGRTQECVYLDAAESLPVWYGSPITRVSFTTQPCKTKLHEIDNPHTWTSFVAPIFLSLCLCRRLSAGPCLFSCHQKINAPKMLAYKVMGY